MPPLLVSLIVSRIWRATLVDQRLDHAQGMTRKLDSLDSEFRTHHHAFIDLIDDEETLQKEQSTLDEHDDFVAELAVRIQQLITVCTPPSDASPRKIASRRLSHLQKSLSSIHTAIASLSGGPDDTCLLRQYSACTHKFPQGMSHEWICITLSGIVLSLQNLELHIRDECSTFLSYFVSMVMTFDLIKHCFLIKILFLELFFFLNFYGGKN